MIHRLTPHSSYSQSLGLCGRLKGLVEQHAIISRMI